jgi:hypothetical protein
VDSANSISQVIIAFMLSASMTVTAVVFVYLSYSMPEKCMTEIDEMIISYVWIIASQLAKKQPRRLFFGCWNWCWSSLRSLWHLLSRRRAVKEHRKLSRAQREEAVNRFILTLSDQ